MPLSESDPTRDSRIQPAGTPGQEFYRRQIALLESNDVEGLTEQYHDDACLVTFDRVVAGRAAIGAYLRGYLHSLGGLTLQSTDHFIETSDSIFFEATVATGLGTARVQDVFVLREGKATHHFAAVISTSPHTLAVSASLSQ